VEALYTVGGDVHVACRGAGDKGEERRRGVKGEKRWGKIYSVSFVLSLGDSHPIF
jgi:hypothetical protein